MKEILVKINGKEIAIRTGVTVAAAILEQSPSAFRRSLSGTPRFPICGMGTCFECRVKIDGVSHRRSCQILAKDGMVVETDE